MVQNYTENIVEAMQIIAQSEIAKLEYDQTIVCTITDASDNKNGHYWVTDGVNTFEAYAENTNYTNQTKVYVVIPKGDWKNKKQITGKYMATMGPITYISALDKMCVLHQSNPLDEVDNNVTYSCSSGSVINTPLNNSICIRFKICTNGVEPPSGENDFFAVKVSAYYEEDNKSVTLPSYTSKQMFGNPFYYLTPVEHEMFFSIESAMDRISGIQITFEVPKAWKGPEVEITDLQVYFGFDTSNHEDNSVFIYPIRDALTYDGAEDDMPETPSVQGVPDLVTDIMLIWINKDAEGRFIGFTDIKEGNELINFNKATDKTKLEFPKEKEEVCEICGKSTSECECVKEDDTGKVYYWIDWFADTIYGNQLLDENLRDKILNPKNEDGTDGEDPKQPDNLARTYSLFLLRELRETEIRAKLWCNGDSYSSNLLQFTNVDVLSSELARLGVQLYLEHTQGKDIYLYQNEMNKEAENAKEIKFGWTSNNRIEDTLFKGADITWMLPKRQTMLVNTAQTSNNNLIHLNEAYTLEQVEALRKLSEEEFQSWLTEQFTQLGLTGEEEQRIFTKKAILIKEYYDDYELYFQVLTEECFGGEDSDAPEKMIEKYKLFNYKIKNTYDESLFNNTIICRLEMPENKGNTEGRKNIAFETFSIQGTDYTFSVAPANRSFGFTELPPEENVEDNRKDEEKGYIGTFIAQLLDPKGKTVKDINVTWTVSDSNCLEIIDKNSNPVKVKLKALGDTVLIASTEVLWGGQKITLTKEHPVSFSKDGGYYSNTPSFIYYDSLGSLFTYELPPLKLYSMDNDDEISSSWVLTGDTIFDLPTINYTIEGEASIEPSPFYTGDVNRLLQAQNNNKVLWSRPLLVRQNRYSNELLNNWNGKLKIDPEAGTILANAIGAGKKNGDNSFSGAFLGTVGQYEEATFKAETGILGYDHGAQAYAFRDDGTAFIGKSGAGRINFDGTQGLIASETIQTLLDGEENSVNWSSETPVQKIKKDENKIEKGLLLDLKSGEVMFDSGDNYFYFTEEEGLDIRANRVKITSGTTTGINLLEETEPSGSFTYPIPINEETGEQQEKPLAQSQFEKIWTYIGDQENEAYKIMSSYNSFDYSGNSIYLTKSGISQMIKLEPKKKYTLSGYAKGEFTTTIVSTSVSFIINPNNGYFKETFSSPVDKEQECEIQFMANGNDSVELYHLKLEEGEEATKWTATGNDVNSRFEITDSKIESAVMGMKDYADGQAQALGTQITQTADSISSFAYAAGAYNFTDTNGNRIQIAVVGEDNPNNLKDSVTGQLVYNPNDYQDKYYLNVVSGEVYLSEKPYSTWKSTGIILDTTYSQIKQEADAITMTVAGADTTWDESDYTIQYKGYGEPDVSSPEENEYYLNLQNGYLYNYNGSEWECVDTLKKITENLSSEIQQTKDAIRLNVQGVSYEWIIPNGLDIAIMSKGNPGDQDFLFPAADYQGKYYLDESTGKVYRSNGNIWEEKTESFIIGKTTIDMPLKQTTIELSSQISQTADEISLNVYGIENKPEGRNYAYYGYSVPRHTLIGKAGEWYLDYSGEKIVDGVPKGASYKWSESSYIPDSVDYWGYERPEERYNATTNKGVTYLMIGTGKIFKSNGEKWETVQTNVSISNNAQEGYKQVSIWRYHKADVDISGFSSLAQSSDKMVAKVKDKAGSGFGWTINNSFFKLFAESYGNTGATQHTVFVCDKDGISVEGRILARSGNIAGWTIEGDRITKGTLGNANACILCPKGVQYTSSGYPIAGSSGTNTWSMVIGNKFGVTTNGTLYATNANISGTIYADRGSFGNWEINPQYIISYGTDSTFYLSSAEDTKDENWIAAFKHADGEETFKVTKTGILHATGVNVSGTIYATAGKIGSDYDYIEIEDGAASFLSVSSNPDDEGSGIAIHEGVFRVQRKNYSHNPSLVIKSTRQRLLIGLKFDYEDAGDLDALGWIEIGGYRVLGAVGTISVK